MSRESHTFHEGYCIENTSAGDAVSCEANELMARMVRGTPNEAKLERLRDSEVASVSHLRSGGSETYIVDLVGSEQKGVFKLCRRESCSVGTEFAASLVAQKLGMGIVPIGVFRTMTIDGEERTGYFYEFIPGKDLSQVTPDAEALHSETNSARGNDVRLFDYLISNWDRHSNGNRGNLILGNDNLLYAIDHGHAFQSWSWSAPTEPFVTKTEVHPARLKALAELKMGTDPEFVAVLRKLIGDQETDALLKKVAHAYGNMTFSNGKVHYEPKKHE